MKVDNATAGVTPQQQISQPAPVAPPATVVPAADTQTPKEDFSPRTAAKMGRTNSFASKPSVPAIQNVTIGQNYPYSAMKAGGNPAATVGSAKATPAPDRKAMLDEMAKGLPPTQRAKVDEASKAYSDQQLKQMKDNGVRFKMGDGMPAERKDKLNDEIPRNADGVYRPHKRTIQLKPDISADGVRHEMAHAWDDAKNEGKAPIRTKDNDPQYLKDGKTDALNHKKAADKAVSLRAQAKAYGPPRDAKLLEEAAKEEKKAGGWSPGYASSDPKMVDAYQKYLKRTDAGDNVSTKVFDNAASPGHSQTSVQEFYAEGYTVFHGTGPEAEKARLKMRENAPELYEQLKAEATEQKLPLPAEPRLQKAPSGDPLLRED